MTLPDAELEISKLPIRVGQVLPGKALFKIRDIIPAPKSKGFSDFIAAYRKTRNLQASILSSNSLQSDRFEVLIVYSYQREVFLFDWYENVRPVTPPT
jgi:hypothetical protein